MKTPSVLPLLGILTAALVRLQAGPADDLLAAAKKLETAGGYAWTTTTANAGGGGGGRFQAGPTHGKVSADGVLHVTMTRGDNTWEVARKGDKSAVKGQEGWQSAAELEDSQGPGRMFARLAERTQAPAAEVKDLVAKAKDLKEDGGALVGSLTEDGVRDLMAFGRRGGGGGPEVSGAKGSVKFWIKDGLIHRYEVKTAGSVSWNGNEREVDRTTTVEVKDVGKTTVELPAEAKAKLS